MKWILLPLKTGQKLYLEEDQSVIAELQNNEILTKNMEEELKNIPESDEFTEKSIQEKLSLFANKLLNIPYKFGGNSILGIDCSGYVKKVYGLLGMDLPRTAREQFNEGEDNRKGRAVHRRPRFLQDLCLLSLPCGYLSRQ